jgi:hypothetical protein
MATPTPDARAKLRRVLLVALATIAAAGCVGVEYARPGRIVDAGDGRVLLFGAIRFIFDGQEYHPWRPALLPHQERHVWLLRLDGRAVSAELHPDADGSLAFWLSPGDYALVGNAEKPHEMSDYREVVALLRVPRETTTVYVGDLVFETPYQEGGRFGRGPFGAATVELQTLEAAVAALQARYGPLPATPAVSPWCVGAGLPSFMDADLASRARMLLDEGCPGARSSPSSRKLLRR